MASLAGFFFLSTLGLSEKKTGMDSLGRRLYATQVGKAGPSRREKPRQVREDVLEGQKTRKQGNTWGDGKGVEVARGGRRHLNRSRGLRGKEGWANSASPPQNVRTMAVDGTHGPEQWKDVLRSFWNLGFTSQETKNRTGYRSRRHGADRQETRRVDRSGYIWIRPCASEWHTRSIRDSPANGDWLSLRKLGHGGREEERVDSTGRTTTEMRSGQRLGEPAIS